MFFGPKRDIFDDFSSGNLQQLMKQFESLTKDDTYEMVVQVNGKIRGKIEVSTDCSREDMIRVAKEIDNVKLFIDGHDIVKEIVVPGKLVNIVVK